MSPLLGMGASRATAVRPENTAYPKMHRYPTEAIPADCVGALRFIKAPFSCSKQAGVDNVIIQEAVGFCLQNKRAILSRFVNVSFYYYTRSVS